MTAPTTSFRDRSRNLNHMRRGLIYLAVTSAGATLGEYLGIESAHDERAILLRNAAGTESIAVGDLTSVLQAA